ncbi:hypothetical protein RI119_20625 [Bacillus amyloliquefaciens]|uniref:hypothetical protein n=1 Tax=Bacillus amyloliquefaciens TaxID=1390 RepID=UPI002EDA5EAD
MMINKVVIEITAEKGIVKLFNENAEEINRQETSPTESGSSIQYTGADFEDMTAEEGMTDELWEALEQNFYVHDVLTAMRGE